MRRATKILPVPRPVSNDNPTPHEVGDALALCFAGAGIFQLQRLLQERALPSHVRYAPCGEVAGTRIACWAPSS